MNTHTLFADPSDDFALPKKVAFHEPAEFDMAEFMVGSQEEQDMEAELNFDAMLFGDTGEDE